MWKCPNCGEMLDDVFDECWKCAGRNIDPLSVASPNPPIFKFGLGTLTIGLFLAAYLSRVIFEAFIPHFMNVLKWVGICSSFSLKFNGTQCSVLGWEFGNTLNVIIFYSLAFGPILLMLAGAICGLALLYDCFRRGFRNRAGEQSDESDSRR